MPYGLPSNGLLMGGAIGNALSQGVDAFLQTKRMVADQDERERAAKAREQQLGLLAAKENMALNPETGGYEITPYGQSVRENALAREKAEQGLIGAQTEYYKNVKGREQGERRLDRNTQKLSAAIDKAGLSELDSIVNTITGNIDLDAKEDIPGVGQTGFAPRFALSQAGKDVRQSVDALQNVVLKARSGGAVTPSEAKRMLNELGYGISRTDAELRQGLKNTIKSLNAKKQNILAGFSRDVLDEFESRGGSVKPLGLMKKETAKGAPPAGKMLSIDEYFNQ